MVSNVKKLTGVVVSTKMDKSIVVQVNFQKIEKRFKKVLHRTKKIMAHDEENKAQLGDRVVVKESRPMSRMKRYTLDSIVEKKESAV